MTILKYETPIARLARTAGVPTIFLAGPTVRGNQPHLTSWRREAEREFVAQGFNDVLIVPEFESKTESDKGRDDIPLWEFEGLKQANVIMFWIPRTRELIGLTTNYELGYWTARNRSKVIYGRPDDAYRCGYTDIMWQADSDDFMADEGCVIWNNLKSTVSAAIELAKRKVL